LIQALIILTVDDHTNEDGLLAVLDYILPDRTRDMSFDRKDVSSFILQSTVICGPRESEKYSSSPSPAKWKWGGKSRKWLDFGGGFRHVEHVEMRLQSAGGYQVHA
jgi:hypothetical protein